MHLLLLQHIILLLQLVQHIMELLLVQHIIMKLQLVQHILLLLLWLVIMTQVLLQEMDIMAWDYGLGLWIME